MNLAYVRVSTEEQNEARQIEILEKYNIDKWYTEKISGKNMDRPKLQELLEFARESDTIYVLDFSRLARSTKDLLELIEILQQKQVQLVSVKESLDTSTPTGKLMLTMIAAINEFERENILERQREGIAIAKRNGKYKGRREKKVDQSKFEALYNDYMSRKITKAKMAVELGISRPTLNKILADKQK